jgi:hypothetical protein
MLREEWFAPKDGPDYGILRLARLFLLIVIFLSSTLLIDELTRILLSQTPVVDRSGKERIKKWVVACSRESFYAARAMFVMVALFTPLHRSIIVVLLVIYFTLDILFSLASGAIVWGRLSINPQRSLILALLNYGEIIVAFAVLYLHFDCIHWQSGSPSASQALYHCVPLHGGSFSLSALEFV